MQAMWRLLVVWFGLGMMFYATPGSATVVNQWVQYGPNNTALIRAIENNPANGCPSATLDGSPLTLTQRGTVTTSAQAPQTDFPVLMCEASVPAFGHTAAIVNGVTLKMPLTNPQKILVIGDTGCRVTAAVSGTQNCNDPTQYPLQFLANYAASFHPDLIIHVGDFFYREQPCPTGFSGCAGNPVFDNWDSWNADWFTPGREPAERRAARHLARQPRELQSRRAWLVPPARCPCLRSDRRRLHRPLHADGRRSGRQRPAHAARLHPIRMW